MTNVNRYTDSDFAKWPERDTMVPPSPPSPCYSEYETPNQGKRTVSTPPSGGPEALPATPSKHKKTPVVISIRKEPIKKKPSPIKYPTGSDHCDQSEDEDVPLAMVRRQENPQSTERAPQRQDLRVKLDGKRVVNTTLKLPNKGPIRNRVNTRQGPWLEGCTPKCNREHAPFIEGRAPNCPEYPRILLQQDANGVWLNNDVCTEGEDEDEVGSAESSKEDEENNK